MASYYGNESGSKTASGQRFNQNAMTCAHRTLPFGTKLRVTHGGRSVIVTVNDRGPFIRGRVLDLSTGAARAIGLTSAGVGRVTAEVVADGVSNASSALMFGKRCVALRPQELLRAKKSLPSPMTAGFLLPSSRRRQTTKSSADRRRLRA